MLGSEIRELVIVKLEEHTPFGDKSGEQLLAGGDILREVKPVYSYIDATLPEAANEALMVIPIEHLTPIVIDPVNDQDGIRLLLGGEKLYPFTGSEEGAEYNGVTYGRRVLTHYITAEIAGEVLTLYRNTDGDITYGGDNYLSYVDKLGLGNYYVMDGVEIVGESVYFITGSSRQVVGEIYSIDTGGEIIDYDEYPITNKWYRGWKGDSAIAYTLGNDMPSVGDTSYALCGSSMVASGTVVSSEAVHRIAAVVDTDDNLIGTIQKPTGYLRLHTLQMGSWTRPVHAVVRPDNPLYVQQFDKWTRGHYCKPVVTDDGKDLHYYSQSANATATAGDIKTFLYVPEFAPHIDYPKDVAEVIALFTAGKIYEIFSQKEQIEIMAKEIESVISTMKL